MTYKTFEETPAGKRIDSTYAVLKAIKPVYDEMDEKGKHHTASCQANYLFYGTDSVFFWTGFSSEKLLETGERKCRQHCWPRLLSTKWMFENFPSTLEEFIPMFIKCAQYDYTTSAENRDLRPFQKEGVFKTPEIADKKAGIVLV